MLHPGGGEVHSHLSKHASLSVAAVGMAPDEGFRSRPFFKLMKLWLHGEGGRPDGLGFIKSPRKVLVQKAQNDRKRSLSPSQNLRNFTRIFLMVTGKTFYGDWLH